MNFRQKWVKNQQKAPPARTEYRIGREAVGIDLGSRGRGRNRRGVYGPLTAAPFRVHIDPAHMNDPSETRSLPELLHTDVRIPTRVQLAG